MSSNKKPNKKDKQKKVVESLTFDENEKEVLTKLEQDLNIDINDESDLDDIPQPPVLTEKELDKLPEDKSIKTIIREQGNDPNIYDTLKDNTIIGDLTDEDIKNIRKESDLEKNKLIITLASFPTIKLHLNAGMKDGKIYWIEKEFNFNSIDKWQELKINTLKARMQTIQYKHAILANKKLADLTEDEASFLMTSTYLIEISGYRLSEYEAKLRFGMNPEDFARVNTDEYALALNVLIWRNNNRPSYKQRR